MKYLIPNAPLPPSHLGDLLQVEPLIDEILEKDKDSEIVVYTSRLPLMRQVINKKNRNLSTLINTGSGKNKTFTLIPQLVRLLRDFRAADASIFTGGSYFKDEGDGKNSWDFLYHIFLFTLAKIFAKKKIVMPISFGPFQKGSWKKSSLKGLNGMDVVMARNENTYDELEKAGLTNVVSSFDASLLKPKAISPLKTDGVVFVISNSTEDDYTLVDQQVAKALGYISRKYKLPITPVIISNHEKVDQTSTDYKSYVRTLRVWKKYRVKVNKLEYVPDSSALLDMYAKHKIVVAMRLHPILMAISQEIPFVAINRNQKTKEILKSLGMDNYYLQAQTLNINILKDKMDEIFRSRRKIKKYLTEKNIEIKKTLRKQMRFSNVGITY